MSKPSIPSWQRAQATPTTPPPFEPEPTSQSQSEPSPVSSAEESTEVNPQEKDVESPSLLEQASKFLEDATICDAPREQKVAFLQSKGVGADEIEKLLENPKPKIASPSLSEDSGERAWSRPAQTAPPPSPPPPPPPQKRDIPPIVTYPEFLAQPVQQPPLITTQRLLNTAYITGGIVATIYGLSKYIVAPMKEQLSESRHDFSAHTQEKLDELNSRMRDQASVDPATKAKSVISDAADDVSEADSDPTELFHRDTGTQTSPGFSRRASMDSDADNEPMVKAHESRLKIITSHLKEIEETKSKNSTSSDSLRTTLSDLTTYLGEMSYQNQYYSGMGGFYGSAYGMSKAKDAKDDQIEVLKGDIRAVKGVFLSARNFPAGGRGSFSAST